MGKDRILIKQAVNENYLMRERKQKTLSQNNGYPQKNRTESEGYVGVQTFMGITENNLVEVILTEEKLLERIVSSTNLNEAYKRVKKNGGSGGVDKMETKELLQYLRANKEALITSIMEGKCQPNPVRRVEIPKENGKKRELGIPTVIDRVIQQAISQVLSRRLKNRLFLYGLGILSFL